MSLVTNFLAGLLLTGMLALAPDISFARGGGGGGHFGGGSHYGGGGYGHYGYGHYGYGHYGYGHYGYGHYGYGHYGYGHRSYYGYYGYYGYPYYGYGYPYYGYAYPYYGYAYPYYDYNDSVDVSDAAPADSTALIKSVQKELAGLGYYHGAIDGIVGSETENAVRWFQSVDHLSVTGHIDGQTLHALGIA